VLSVLTDGQRVSVINAPAGSLQPPKPQIQPSERILQLAADRDRDMEAAD
jgi:hypothetical protein